jgi:parallel beta helix pectate lyase-like protein
MTMPTRRRLLGAGAALGLVRVRDVEAAQAAAVGTGVLTLGAARAGSIVLIHGSGGDTTDLWQEAFQSISRVGHGAVRVVGDHVISKTLTLPDVHSLEIVGDGDALLRKGKPGQEFTIFSNEPLQAPLPILAIRNIRFLGDWDEKRSKGGDGSRCIAVRGYHRVFLHSLSAEAFRQMTLTADDCDEVLVDGCRVLRSAGDSINLSGSRFAKVVNCTIQNAWDDAVAVHVPRDVTDESRRYATIISNNHILQANGIKVLGGRDVTIAGNQIIAPNNYGIYLGRDSYWHEGNVPLRNIVVADNIISEMLPHEYLQGQGDVGTGIFLIDSGRKILSTRICGNVVTKYKPSGRGVHYSDWGLGSEPDERRLFTSDGWTDPELVHGHKGKGTGIRIIAANADDTSGIVTDGNSFVNLGCEVDRQIDR